MTESAGSAGRSARLRLAFAPLERSRWPDFENLFGERGACGGCWCMLWRMTRTQHERNKGDGNRRAMKRLVEAGAPTGILAYAGKTAIGWCAVAPREDYPALARSRVLKPLDERPVWSVACLFIERQYRRRGVSVRLLGAVIDHVRERGGTIVEGYPVEPRKDTMPDVFAWTGLASAFEQAGFRERGRGSETRPIMRYEIGEPEPGRPPCPGS